MINKFKIKKLSRIIIKEMVHRNDISKMKKIKLTMGYYRA